MAHCERESKMTEQVYLTRYGIWSDIIDQCDMFILARDADGVNVYVVKDGMQMVRAVK